MTLLLPKRLGALAVSCSALFVVGFPVSLHYAPGGALSAVLLAVPLVLIAWALGFRVGLIAAVSGIIYVRTLFSIEYFLVRHNSVDSFWILSAIETSLAFLVIGAAVGKLSDSLRALKAANSAREKAESEASAAERHYRELIDLAPQGVCVVQDSRFVLINAKLAVMAGYAGEEMKHAPFTDFVKPEDRGISLELMRRAMEGNAEVEHATVRLLCRDGGAKWLEINARKAEWDGRPAALCFSSDVTGRRLAEEALRSSHAHLEAILRAVPDLMFEVDKDGRFYEMPTPNPHRLLVPPEVFVSKTVHEVLPERASAIAMGAIQKAASTGSVTGATYPLMIDGEERWFELSISAIGDHESPMAHFVAAARDITERMRIEERAERVRNMEAVSRLAGGIAHDINNILQVILGSCDLMCERADDAERTRKSLAVIMEAVKRAACLTGQLLSFSQMQAAHPVLSDLNAFLRSSRESLREALGDVAELNLCTTPEAAWVHADPVQLRVLIVNLAKNAREAMPGGGTLCIDTRCTRIDAARIGVPADVPPGDYVVLEFRDTGVGMDRESLSHIFEPFYTTKEFGKGEGLGLSIVYGIVRQMRGHVSVSSRPGEGTSILVSLPLARSAS